METSTTETKSVNAAGTTPVKGEFGSLFPTSSASGAGQLFPRNIQCSTDTPAHEVSPQTFSLPDLRLKKLAGAWEILPTTTESSISKNPYLVKPSRQAYLGLGTAEGSALSKRPIEDERELQLDRSGLIYRLDILKLKALAMVLAGIYYHPGEEQTRPAWHQHFLTTVDQLLTQAADKNGSYNKQDLTVLRSLNLALPEHYHIDLNGPANRPLLDSAYELALAMKHRQPLPAEELLFAQRILGQIIGLQQQLHRSHQAVGDLFIKNPTVLLEGEKKLLSQVKLSYRKLLKEFSTLEELSSWYSPTYRATFQGQCGPHQSSEPYSSDYQRLAMTELTVLERLLSRQHFKDSQYFERIESVLLPNGMGALHAILEYLERKEAFQSSDVKRPFFKEQNIYFEADAVISTHCNCVNRGLREFAPTDIPQLLEAIKTDWPAAVFISPLQMSFEQRVTDIAQLLRGLCSKQIIDAYYERCQTREPAASELLVVVDNTCASRLATWRGFNFCCLPPFMKVVSFESLIKYGQDGLELTPAALVTGIGQNIGSAIRSHRSELGLTPPESTVHRLQNVYNQQIVDARLARHSRNTAVIVNILEKSCQQKPSFLSKVVSCCSPRHPDYKTAQQVLSGAGGVFNVGFNFGALLNYQEVSSATSSKPFEGNFLQQTNRVAAAFVNLVHALAKQLGLELNHGTSYGFDIPRLALYETEWSPALFPLRNEERKKDLYFFLRVASGTENLSEAILLGHILARANETFSTALAEKTLSNLVSRLETKGPESTAIRFLDLLDPPHGKPLGVSGMDLSSGRLPKIGV